MNASFEPFERELLQILLAGDVEPLPTLRAQLAAATVAERKYTGVGVFTDFRLPLGAPKAQPLNFEVTDVAYELEGAQNGGGVILFVRDGLAETLEVFNYTDDWPVQPRFTSITYLVPDGPPLPKGGRNLKSSATRDFDDLRRAINEPSRKGASA